MSAYARFADMSRGSYDIILADPPWLYAGSPSKDQAAGKHYDCMSVEQLVEAHPVADLLTKRGILFLWATGPRLMDAMDFIQRSGLYFRGVPFNWVKTNSSGRPVGAQGVRPSIVKPTSEFVLAASKVRSGRPLPLLSERIRQVVMAPRGDHSSKPEQVQRRIEHMYGPRRRLEMYARTLRFGWDSFGNDPALFDRLAPGPVLLERATRVTSYISGWGGLVVRSWFKDGVPWSTIRITEHADGSTVKVLYETDVLASTVETV